MLDLNNWGIPWVALIDGDSLKPGSGNIWAEIEKTECMTNEKANCLRGLSFEDQVKRLQEFEIYVMGTSSVGNFEKVLEAENPCVRPNSLFGSKVIEGRWWAQNIGCPPIVKGVFERIRKTASLQPGDISNLVSESDA